MNKTTTFLSIAAIAAIAGIALSTGLNTRASEVDTTATTIQSAPEKTQGCAMKGKGMHGDPATREAVKTAITANDFTAFQTAVAEHANSPLASIDTAEEFAKLVKMHSLLDEAKAIGEELGLPGPHGGDMMGRGGKGYGKWMK